MSSVLITHVQIFDGSGRAPFPGEVLVRGNRIEAVTERPDTGAAGTRGAALPANGATVIDGQGGTLLPGLVEPHGHPSFPDAATRDDFVRLPPEEHTLRTMHNARTMLDCGYTSCLSAASAKPRLDVVVRNEIEAGRIPGPRLLANGPEITVTGGLGDVNQSHLPHLENSAFSWVADGPDEIRRIARILVREGVDLLKLNISGDPGQASAQARETVMTEAEVTACMEVARSRGLRVCAHARSAESVKMCLRHGIDIIYHANNADEEALDGLEAAKGRVFVVPTLGHTYNIVHGSPYHAPIDNPAAQEELHAGIETVAALRRRGVRVLPGGDYGFAYNPHGTYARDLMHFVELLGFSPADTLRAATQLGGEIMGRPQELGLVRPGYLADLLVVRGDPLQDIRLLQERDNLLLIMKDGACHKSPAAPGAAQARSAAG
jgi:imidazolonepropionase-like amidohydrolase